VSKRTKCGYPEHHDDTEAASFFFVSWGEEGPLFSTDVGQATYPWLIFYVASFKL